MTIFFSRLNSFKRFFFLILSFPLFVGSTHAQNYKGRDGAGAYITPGTYILNRYTALASSVNAGSLSFSVTDIAELKGSHSFPNAVNPYAIDALSKGDLVMIVQVQGADIASTDDANYGAVTNYNTTGNYELKTVFSVSGNTILLCENLTHSYTQAGNARTQVIRIPRFSTLNVGPGVVLTGLAWQGATGGVVAIEADNDITLNGKISANAIGFRGGSDDKAVSVASGGPAVLLYRMVLTTTTAGKGESIAGFTADYNSLFNGANGRGAAANGGGGGNGHNSGGGGGSNAGVNGVLMPWNGTGLKNISTPAWIGAWELEAVSFSTDVSTGAGRGGYTYSSSNQDALVTAPGNNAWGGDHRQVVGGFGGRPLDYQGNTRLFFGGGGGAGDGNNSSAGNGGNGGGIAYILSNGNITGTGSITADGQNGFDTQNAFIDAAGGAGGGGAIVALVEGSITGVSMQANGGTGGNQLVLLAEAEGPGGGGGGGYIASTATGVSRSVNGGANGVSYSAQVTEFVPNGATQGAGGTMATTTFSDVYACDPNGYVLPIKLLSFTAILQYSSVDLNWIAEGDRNDGYFEVERSLDGKAFSRIATVNSMASAMNKANYSHADNISGLGAGVLYYRLKLVDKNHKHSYSEVRIIRSGKEVRTAGFTTFPNPVISELNVSLPIHWQGQKIKLEIFDVTGKLSRSLELNTDGQTASVSVAGLGKGLYVVRASMGAEAAQQRIIKD